MRPDADRGKVVLALKRAIVATFDDGKWRELGYLTGTIDRIEKHGRLLRSLYWNDPDYESCVYQVLPDILGSSDRNLQIIEQYAGLEGWLRAKDPALHAELYGGSEVVPLAEVEEAAGMLDIIELERHAARIRQGIRSDPAQAIGSAKELLETVLKGVLGEHGAGASDDVPALLKKAQERLELAPRMVDASVPGAATLRRTLSNLGQVVVGVAEVRNLYGTGHGRARGPELEIAHARLVVNAAVTLATFLLEVWQARGQR